MAKFYGNHNDEENCKKWLIRCQKEGLLPDCENLHNDHALDSMRGKPWFEEIIKTACP
ncbi:MAG: hypothetical protein K9L30_04750 [Desulfobacterales bacterium]|nr:hypothetical protein [Desulfobacterales bacterium]